MWRRVVSARTGVEVEGVGCGMIRMGEIEIKYNSTGGRVGLRAWAVSEEMGVSGRAKGVGAWGRISGAGLVRGWCGV